MRDLLSWIDKSVDQIDKELLFIKLFNEIKPNEDDNNTIYFSNYNEGIELVLSKFRAIESIHLFGSHSHQFKKFKGQLPLKIEFTLSRRSVKEILGLPQKSGGGHQNILLGLVNEWDKYYFSNYSLRFEYPPDENEITLLTIASLRLESVFDISLQ